MPSASMKIPTSAPTALDEAQLRSERLRILGVVSFLAIFVIVTLVRVFLIQTVSKESPWIWGVLLVGGIIAYELWMLIRVNTCLRAGDRLPVWIWLISGVLEIATPAVFIAFLASRNIEPAYRPLATPAVLVFLVFIILSTLRLRPWTCWVTGVAATAFYLLAALLLGWRPPMLGVAAPVTQTNVTLNAVTLLLGGVIAGLVAGQICKYLEAALREAETRKKLEVMEHDMQLARSIQQSLLPKKVPALPGFDIAGWNKPADSTGGDYFDWMTLPNGKLVTTLADVTGHGIGPALLAAVCRAYARSTFDTNRGLSSALERINHDLKQDLMPGQFVTFVAATCAPESDDAEVLSAGHAPLFIYSRSEDRFTELDAQGVPLGILPSFVAEPPVKVDLKHGDLLLLITDGFFEWENDKGEQFGVQRLEDVLRVSQNLSSPEIIANLHEAVTKFAHGTGQQDDLTAILIKRI